MEARKIAQKNGGLYFWRLQTVRCDGSNPNDESFAGSLIGAGEAAGVAHGGSRDDRGYSRGTIDAYEAEVAALRRENMELLDTVADLRDAAKARESQGGHSELVCVACEWCAKTAVVIRGLSAKGGGG